MAAGTSLESVELSASNEIGWQSPWPWCCSLPVRSVTLESASSSGFRPRPGSRRPVASAARQADRRTMGLHGPGRMAGAARLPARSDPAGSGRGSRTSAARAASGRRSLRSTLSRGSRRPTHGPLRVILRTSSTTTQTFGVGGSPRSCSQALYLDGYLMARAGPERPRRIPDQLPLRRPGVTYRASTTASTSRQVTGSSSSVAVVESRKRCRGRRRASRTPTSTGCRCIWAECADD